MKINRIFWITAFLTAVLFVFLIFNRDDYHKEHQQQEVNKHALIISESLWSYNPDLAKDYLQFVCKANKYKTLVVMFSSNEEFISINYALDNPIDLFFESLSLIRITPLKSEISREGIVIGEISVEWYNTAIYAYIYIFIVILLLLIVFWLFLGTFKQKGELEDRVRERTADLKKEIQERKQVEETLLESEELFRGLFNYSPVGINVFNMEGKVIAVNGIARNYFGVSENDQLSNYRLFDDSSISDETKWKIKNGQLAREERYIDFKAIKQMGMYSSIKNGNDIICISLTYAAYGPDKENPLGIVAFIQDITERKQMEEALRKNEEKFRSYVDSAPHGVFVADKNGNYVEVNSAACKITGYSSEELLSMNLRELCPPESLEIIEDHFKRVVNKGIASEETAFIRKDGSKEFWTIDAVKLSDDRFLGFVVDITERKLTEEKLTKHHDHLEKLVKKRTAKLEKSQQSLVLLLADVNESRAELDISNKKLEASNKELEAFSYSVSHDLRAPLRAIDGFTRILLQDYVEKLDDEAKRLGAVIQKNSRKMGQLIDDLLAFSRLGRASMLVSNINMKDIVNAVYLEATTSAERKRISFTVADLPKINGDQSMFRQVWVNLISNAIKFSAKQPQAVISITCRENKKTLDYCIKDNGAGFNKKYGDKLFGVFQRLHNEKEFSGTGVGLALVKRIIQRHEGRIWAESEVDKGAAFYFSLPKK